MNLTTIQTRILKALKNADMNSSELLHRFGKSVAVHLKEMADEELVTKLGDIYSITQKGSAAAPKTALDLVPAVAPVYEVKKAERISINAKIDVDALSKYIPPSAVKVAENERLNVIKEIYKVTNTSEPRALQVLRVIEAHPGCNHADIEYATDLLGATGYIKGQIKGGRVLVGGTARKRTFTLAAGETAESAYNGGSRIRFNKPEPAPDLHADDIAVPEFLKKPEVEIPAAEAAPAEKITHSLAELIEKLPVASEVPVPSVSVNQSRKIKFAFTNESTLMIFGLQYEPIELSKDETEDLVCFCNEMDLTFNVGVA